jgi:hypothetical protein
VEVLKLNKGHAVSLSFNIKDNATKKKLYLLQNNIFVSLTMTYRCDINSREKALAVSHYITLYCLLPVLIHGGHHQALRYRRMVVKNL